MFELPTFSSGGAWMPAVDAIAKASLIFAAATVLSLLLRRRSAAARHMIWTLALGSVLVLPALSLLLPRWQVPLVTLNSRLELPSATPSLAMPVTVARLAPVRRSPAHVAAPAVSDPAPLTQSSAIVQKNTGSWPNISWPALLTIVWMTGVLLVLGRLAVGIAAVQWMSRRIERVTGAPWLEQARALARTLGVSPRIVFLRSGTAAMPMAWGIFRPAVLMPADADTWPAERLRIVLLHELAHVKRRDCLTHMVAQIACAFHWFNPLAWIAARHARTERERACDDLVLAAGTRGPDYADELIEIARVMRSGRFPAVLAGASLAMAHRSELEGRLMAILDPQIPRAGVSRPRTAAATAMFALAVMPLAAMQPWTVASSDGPAAPLPAQEVTPAPAPRPAEARSADPVPSPRAHGLNTERAAEAIAAGVQSSVQAAIQGSIQANVQPHIQSNIDQSVIASVESSVETAVHSALSGMDALAHVNPEVVIHQKQQHNAGEHGAAQGKTADPRMVAALTAALKDTDKDVRETALHALIQMRDPGIFEPLVQALTDVAADVREQAATGLGQLRDRRAVEPLTNALKDANADVREQAAFALDFRPLQRWSLSRFATAAALVLVTIIALQGVYRLFIPVQLSLERPPACGTNNVMILMAQAVPTAEAVPCVVAVPTGWDIDAVTVERGRARFRLVAPDHVVEVTLRPPGQCSIDGADEVPSDELNMRRFERPTQLPPTIRTTRTYLAAGSCVTYDYRFDNEDDASLLVELDPALGFQPRRELVDHVADRTELWLCGVQAPPCDGGT